MTRKDQIKKKSRFGIWFLLMLLLIGVAAFAGTQNFTFLQKNVASGSSSEPQAPDFSAQEKRLYAQDPALKSSLDFDALIGLVFRMPTALAAPVSVVIENLDAARPQQTGLEQADIVYETVAEGGITRFLAVFKNRTPAELGPVRSARPYFVDWAEEHGGAFVHVGGSPEAIEKLSASKTLVNINETLGQPTIYRNLNYPSPHNAFTTLALIADEMKQSEFQSPKDASALIFKKPNHSPGNILTVAIDFSTPIYGVKYLYHPNENYYERLLAGKPHHAIHPSNVIVQFTEQRVTDGMLRVNIQTVGTGKALVFRNGEMIEGVWQKEEGGMTQFTDAQGEPIKLVPGQTWIEVVSKEMGLNYF